MSVGGVSVQSTPPIPGLESTTTHQLVLTSSGVCSCCILFLLHIQTCTFMRHITASNLHYALHRLANHPGLHYIHDIAMRLCRTSICTAQRATCKCIGQYTVCEVTGVGVIWVFKPKLSVWYCFHSCYIESTIYGHKITQQLSITRSIGLYMYAIILSTIACQVIIQYLLQIKLIGRGETLELPFSSLTGIEVQICLHGHMHYHLMVESQLIHCWIAVNVKEVSITHSYRDCKLPTTETKLC